MILQHRSGSECEPSTLTSGDGFRPVLQAGPAVPHKNERLMQSLSSRDGETKAGRGTGEEREGKGEREESWETERGEVGERGEGEREEMGEGDGGRAGREMGEGESGERWGKETEEELSLIHI